MARVYDRGSQLSDPNPYSVYASHCAYVYVTVCFVAHAGVLDSCVVGAAVGDSFVLVEPRWVHAEPCGKAWRCCGGVLPFDFLLTSIYSLMSNVSY